MFNRYCLLLLLSSVVVFCDQDPDYYVAASLQHATVWKEGSNYGVDTQLANLAVYEQYISQAKQQGAQIMVFPEYGTGQSELIRSRNAKYGETYSDPGFNACEADSQYQSQHPVETKASCLAKQYQMVLVIGCVDVQPCSRSNDSSCPSDNMYIYNAAVVFDETGKLIQKYYKYHIFFTLTGVFDIPKQPQVRYFDTSFGIRFGMFICFEILFPVPALEEVNMGIQHYVYPTSWVNVPPIVTSIQTQQSWSRKYHTAIIAANNGDSHSVSGSGIYHDGTILASFFDPTLSGSADEKLLIAKIPKKFNTSSPKSTTSQLSVPQKEILLSKKVFLKDSICGIVPGSCDFFKATPGSSGTLKASDGNISCTASYSVSQSSPNSGETFALYTISSWVWFSQWLDIRSCGVIKCIDSFVCILLDPLEKAVYQSTTVFDSIKVQGGFTSNTVVLPLVAINNGQIIQPEYTTYQGSSISVTTPEPIIDVSLFGLIWNTTTTQ